MGIGASAGGLEALESFLVNMPSDSGMAFVVVQHLDPLHRGAMVELLQRSTKMPVVEVTDRQRVEPNRVYVIPPGKDISILHGVLHLLPMEAPRGLNLPIDYFFRSLAADRQEASIAVVLSGMGSDGTLGLRAIKEKAGATFVQSLASAKFDGMPRSAIDAGLADVVAPVEEIPEKIVAFHRHAPHIARPEADEPEATSRGAFEKVLLLLREHTGNDFSLYKRSTVERRIERRMGLHQVDRLSDYQRYLRENPREIALLFKELLIGVTSFFRDAEAWEHLRTQVLPELARGRAGGMLRAWVPACSTGEEAYSLAMVLTEALDEVRAARSLTFQIFATDLDKEAIDRARLGVYPANIAADVSPERLRRFFHRDDSGYRVRKEIREMVVFAPQNVITDPPFTKLDMLSCRNLLIYLSGNLQRRLIPLFHYSLNSAGVLFLGSAETVGTYTSLFTPLDGKTRIYKRLEPSLGAAPVEFPSAFFDRGEAADRAAKAPDADRPPPANLQMLADRIIVQRFAPAAVLTNDRGDILYLSARTGRYLEPAVGRASMNIHAMARDGLRYELAAAFGSALKTDRPIEVRGLRVRTNGSLQVVDLTVLRLVEPKELRGTVMIVISDVPDSVKHGPPQTVRRTRTTGRVSQLERDLQQAREEAQTTREEMQTSQEELKSTNEELQSTNEELQSTNEELTTSKEEMQSMNEELQTVNHELQSKIDDLAHANNDMRNLLNSTDVATLFLDGELLVRRFTTPTARIIKLIPSDAGRPITDIATELDYPALSDDAREVLRTLVFKETQVGSNDGRWFTVRIMPYRTLESVIDGVVITFTDTTASKQLETALREQAKQLRQMAEALPNLVWVSAPSGACEYVNRRWLEYTGAPERSHLGEGWLDLLHPEDRERVRKRWNAAVGEHEVVNAELRLRAKGGDYRWFQWSATPVRDEEGAVVKWYGAFVDIDELNRTRHEYVGRLSRVREMLPDLALVFDRQLRLVDINRAVETALGRPKDELRGAPLSRVAPGTQGSSLEHGLRDVLAHRRDATFPVTFETPGLAGTYSALLFASADDEVTALLRREESSPARGA